MLIFDGSFWSYWWMGMTPDDHERCDVDLDERER